MNLLGGHRKPSLLHISLVPCVLWVAVCGSANAKDDTPGVASRETRSGTVPAQAATRPGADSSIKVHNGLLTIAVRSRPLTAVLEDVSRAGHVAIMFEDTRTEAPAISLRAQDLPLDQVLLRMLKGYDSFFLYGPDEKGTAVLKAVWVYPKGRGQGLAPLPPELWASTKDVEKRLDDSNADVRAKAIETLISRKGPEALDAILTALKDDHSQVRTHALYGAMTAGVPVPPDTLSTLALTDPSADIRFLALDALSNDPGVKTLAEQALNDPSPHVQQKARELLGSVGTVSTDRLPPALAIP
jgi:hypothetical protein